MEETPAVFTDPDVLVPPPKPPKHAAEIQSAEVTAILPVKKKTSKRKVNIIIAEFKKTSCLNCYTY